MSRPDVSVVIVSYNTRELILRCLTELYASLATAPSVSVTAEVVVVDNASTDGSADAVAERFPQVRLVRLTDNVGFGRGVNRGALVSSGRYLLCLNPDTEPVGNPVAALVDFADRHPGHGMYTGRTLRPDGTDDNYSCWGLPTLWSTVGFATGLSTVLRGRAWADPEGLPNYDRRTVREVPALSGCLLLIERELFGRLGGFDPRYFLYSEDIDLSTRARALGARPVLTPDAQVVHLVGASSSSEGQRIRLLRGRSTYLRQHWSPTRARLGIGLLTAGVGLRALGRTLLGRDRSRGVDWVDVWRSRGDWAPGYPPVDEDRPTTERLASVPH
ncbi:glycosyltransferase family 2 protein [Solwaraspora sp. WMMD791]|uniref:glycosyltransferase family 2 protein n=1 Tax=Solwaraspora sp. WMMD791 TaxID=3016086 RepID=UPI00249BAE1B|nr:glycosyltransferase family 2 protein [Solwaraspora sp. WMMD791]WFE30203.1 glycosyltransferase family 2 protein [Solwaraspora sp. WMMD791]